jgi:catechol 2,3-dioxygenase-like lactoylglutathione lyase family enzyme
MIHALDRVTIAASCLPDAARAYETLLGRRAQDGNGGASIQLSNVRLDLVADCSHGPGLTALAFGVADLDGCERLLSRRGLPVQRPANLGSACLLADRQATYGVPLEFYRRPQDLEAPLSPAQPGAEATAVTALDHLVIRTPNPERAIALYAGRLGLSLRLDRSHADWGARLLFFRCGALTIELVHDLKDGVGEGEDRLWGLSWCVGDVLGAHARLRAAIVELSEVRSGRRPGTAVFTVRSHNAGVATLLIGPDPGTSGLDPTPGRRRPA